MTLGQIIKKYRNDNKLTMQKFADRANVSKAYISMLEKNKNPANGKPIKPAIDTVRALAHAMDKELDELILLLDETQELMLSSERCTLKQNHEPLIEDADLGNELLERGLTELQRSLIYKLIELSEIEIKEINTFVDYVIAKKEISTD